MTGVSSSPLEVYTEIDNPSIKWSPYFGKTWVCIRRKNNCFFFALAIIEQVLTIQHNRKFSNIVTHHSSQEKIRWCFRSIIPVLIAVERRFYPGPEVFAEFVSDNRSQLMFCNQRKIRVNRIVFSF